MSRLGGWISGALSRSYIQVAVCLHWKALLVTADVIEFRDCWAGLALKSLSGWKKRSCFLCLLWALESIYRTGTGSLWIKSQRLNHLNFRTIEPVQHQSCSVESVEEASNLGMFPVESLLGTSQWLNHPLTAVEFLNFRRFEPVLHRSRWVWKRPI